MCMQTCKGLENAWVLDVQNKEDIHNSRTTEHLSELWSVYPKVCYCFFFLFFLWQNGSPVKARTMSAWRCTNDVFSLLQVVGTAIQCQICYMRFLDQSAINVHYETAHIGTSPRARPGEGAHACDHWQAIHVETIVASPLGDVTRRGRSKEVWVWPVFASLRSEITSQ